MKEQQQEEHIKGAYNSIKVYTHLPYINSLFAIKTLRVIFNELFNLFINS